MKRALITGITGQDGSYLAEHLQESGYEVHGIFRRKSTLDYGNVEHLKDKIDLIYGDITDVYSLLRALERSEPDEVYNLAAQSFVATSWEQPAATAQIDGVGALNMLEAIRTFNKKIRFYQASTSEMFGLAQQIPQTESTPFYPRSPYGVAKLYAHWITKNYRESYGIFACSGILFNHASPRRGGEFVSRKITDAVAKIKIGELDCLRLGNLSSKRDWGFAGDYIRAMWQMLQHDRPSDYVVATGETHEIREFAQHAFSRIGVGIEWRGKGVDEKGVDSSTGRVLIEVDPKFFRPAEVEMLVGDSSRIRSELGWMPRMSFRELVNMMVDADIERHRPCEH
jgi:GDPmannose 4,6-dehydratase